MSHAWNAVLIDGEWLQLDCTWDDPTNVIGGDPYCSGHENHQYLFMTEAQLAERTWSWDQSRINLGVSR